MVEDLQLNNQIYGISSRDPIGRIPKPEYIPCDIHPRETPLILTVSVVISLKCADFKPTVNRSRLILLQI